MLPPIGPLEAEQRARQRRLAGAVGSDHGDDLARPDVDIDALQDGPARPRHLQPAGTDERRRVVRGRRVAMRAVAVMVVVMLMAMTRLLRPIAALLEGQGRQAGLALHIASFDQTTASSRASAQSAHRPPTSTTAPGRREAGRRGGLVDGGECLVAVHLGDAPARLAAQHQMPRAHVVARHDRQRTRCGSRSDARCRPSAAHRSPGTPRSAPAARRAAASLSSTS